jgi:site-specific DNA recombinase
MRVGLWIRVSTEMQVKKESPKVHKKRLEQYAADNKMHVGPVYDLCASGKAVSEQAQTRQMKRDIESKRIDGLLFYDITRLARKTITVLELAEFFRSHNAKLISIKERIDLTTPTGMLMLTMLAAMAENELAHIRQRALDGAATRASMGRPLGGAAPFGYRWMRKRKLIPDKRRERYQLVQTVFRVFIEQRSKRRAARELNRLGVEAPNGNHWSDTTVDRILRCTTYIGKHVLNHTKSSGKCKGWKSKPKSDWSELTVKPIIDRKTWNKAQLVLSEIGVQGCGRRAVYPLSGRLRCACGGKMYPDITVKPARYVCKDCRAKVGLQSLHDGLSSYLTNYKFDPNQILGLPAEPESGAEKQLKVAYACRDRLQQQEERLFDLYADGHFGKEVLGRKLEERRLARAQNADEVARLEGLAQMSKSRVPSSAITSELRNLGQLWPKMTAEEQKSLAQKLVESVVYDHGTVTIRLYLLPLFRDNVAS